MLHAANELSLVCILALRTFIPVVDDVDSGVVVVTVVKGVLVVDSGVVVVIISPVVLVVISGVVVLTVVPGYL